MKIVLYTSNTCGGCVLLKNELDKASVEYESRNISIDPKFKKDLMKQGIMGVPALFIEGHEPIVGYQYDKIKEILDI